MSNFSIIVLTQVRGGLRWATAGHRTDPRQPWRVMTAGDEETLYGCPSILVTLSFRSTWRVFTFYLEAVKSFWTWISPQPLWLDGWVYIPKADIQMRHVSVRPTTLSSELLQLLLPPSPPLPLISALSSCSLQSSGASGPGCRVLSNLFCFFLWWAPGSRTDSWRKPTSGVGLIQASCLCLQLEFGNLPPRTTNGRNGCFPYLIIMSTRAGLFSVLYP